MCQNFCILFYDMKNRSLIWVKLGKGINFIQLIVHEFTVQTICFSL